MLLKSIAIVVALGFAFSEHKANCLQVEAPRGQDLTSGLKQCNPMFNISSFINNNSKQSNATTPDGASRRRDSDEPEISFSVGDIDLPVGAAEGSISSAMSLITTFSQQLDPMSSDEDENENEDEDETTNGDLDEIEPSLGSSKKVSNVIKFRENKLYLSSMNLSMLSVQLAKDEGDPKFGIGITIKNTTLTGKFNYIGPLAVPLTRLSGMNNLKGYYSISIDNIYLLVSSNLIKEKVKGVVLTNESSSSREANSFRLRTDDFRLNVTNLGYINIQFYDDKSLNKPTENYLLRMLQKLLQRTIKRTYFTFENYIRNNLELESRRILDCELTRFNHLLATVASANATEQAQVGNNKARGAKLVEPGTGKEESFDKVGLSKTSTSNTDLARIIGNEIENSRLSKVLLPDFEHHQNILGSVAKIDFFNGSLSGLETIRLNGETRIKLQDEHLLMNTSIGWASLKPYYNWRLVLGNGAKTPVSQGFVSFNISDVDFDAVVTKGLKSQARISVEQLTIRHLENPKMDIGGLPGMNRLTRAMVNFFMGRLKQRLSGAIQPILKLQLERSLNKLLLLS